MPTQPLVIITLATLAALTLVWTLLRFQTGHGPRVILRGVGVLLTLAGLWASGLAMLTGNGIRSIVDWVRRTPMDTTMIVGLSLLGAGLLVFVVGSLLRPRSKEERAARKQAVAGPSTGRQIPAAAPTGTRPTAAPKAAPKAALDDEDAEIEALLRKRGIE